MSKCLACCLCLVLPVGGDCSGLDAGGIGVCCIFWLVLLIAVFNTCR